MDQTKEVKVYLDNKPCGTIKVVDGQLLLYPVDKAKRHITTQNLNEVIAFFRNERQR
jgi:hypothetical protein